jgi:diguanylate cyclase (GGDEF)-like protein
MKSVVETLFDYLGDVIYDPVDAVLDIETLPEEYRVFASGLKYFAESVMETKALAQAMSKGDLTSKLPSRGNEIASPLKSLHSSLKHLTWQAQQIAKGDYTQRVDFMGEFSDAFNMMVEQLAERQRKLEGKISQIQRKTKSLEQSNLLLTSLMQHVPQQIFVIDKRNCEILLMNSIAEYEVNNDPDYVKNLLYIMSDYEDQSDGNEVSIIYTQGKTERYFSIRTYYIEWKNTNAEVFAISDVSATKNKINELEIKAYRDSITQLYNRYFGMLTLDNWLSEKKHFVLIFADLDHLKYINDEFGHNEGDAYILNAARYFRSFSLDAIVCRIGGDEFMLLVPDMSYDEAIMTMSRISQSFQNDDYLKDKVYTYSFSFGIVAVDSQNKLSASDILSIADERMYENKRLGKKNRQS